MAVSQWVKDLVEDVVGTSKMRVGAVLLHPSGRKVKVVSGQYWGAHGLSNFWEWREVKPDGALGKLEHGYGWC